jgi:hypothetical protein
MGISSQIVNFCLIQGERMMETAQGKGISMAAIVGLVLLMSLNTILYSEKENNQPTTNYPEASLPYSQAAKLTEKSQWTALPLY